MNKLKKLKSAISEMFENVKFRITCTIQANKVKRLYLKELKNNRSTTTGLGGINSQQLACVSERDVELVTHTNVLRHLLLVAKTMDNVYNKLRSAGYTDQQFASALHFKASLDDSETAQCRELINKAFQVMDAYKKAGFKPSMGEVVNPTTIINTVTCNDELDRFNSDDPVHDPLLGKDVLRF